MGWWCYATSAQAGGGKFMVRELIIKYEIENGKIRLLGVTGEAESKKEILHLLKIIRKTVKYYKVEHVYENDESIEMESSVN